jgi:hypothetical protein
VTQRTSNRTTSLRRDTREWVSSCREWPLFSTTGYGSELRERAFRVRKEREGFVAHTQALTGMHTDIQEVFYENRRRLEVAMSSEVNTLGHRLNRITEWTGRLGITRLTPLKAI